MLQPKAQQPLKVMVVDDEPDLREMLADEMRDAGYEVVTASSGNQALSLLGSANVDVVISDIRMPDGNGLELLEKLSRQHRPRPAFIFITGYSDQRVDELYEMGAEAVFQKPLNLRALRDVVALCATPKQATWQRVQQRAGTSFSATFSTPDQPNGAARVVNLSLSGAFFAVSDPKSLPASGSQIEFRFSSAYPRTLRVTGIGIVRWSRPVAEGVHPIGFSLEFQQVDQDSRHALAILINEAKTAAPPSGGAP